MISAHDMYIPAQAPPAEAPRQKLRKFLIIFIIFRIKSMTHSQSVRMRTAEVERARARVIKSSEQKVFNFRQKVNECVAFLCVFIS